MKRKTMNRYWLASSMAALMLAGGLAGSGCETQDDNDTYFACQDFCAKKYLCDAYQQTSAETEVCVTECRDTIESGCANKYQAGVNDQINACVLLECGEFSTCMHYQPSPECFDFFIP
jgi:hypothetical protein